MIYTIKGQSKALSKAKREVEEQYVTVQGTAAKLKIDMKRDLNLEDMSSRTELFCQGANVALENAGRYSALAKRVPRTGHHKAIEALRILNNAAPDRIIVLKRTTEALTRDSFVKLSFASRTSLLIKTTWHEKGDVPEQLIWNLDFQCLRLPNNPVSWEIVGFDPKDFLEWWRDDSEQQQGVSESNVWEDAKRLGRKLYYTLSLSKDQVITASVLHDQISTMCMKARSAVLHLMYLLSYCSRAKDSIRMIFEVTAPVVYLIVKLTACAQVVLRKSELDFDGIFVEKLRRHLKIVTAIISKIQVFLLSLGASLDLDRQMEFAEGLTEDLPTYSPAEITQHCKPIMSTLTDDVDEMVVFVDETHKKESDLGEMDCEFLEPITPRPCLDVNINFIASLGLKQIYDLVGPEEWLGEGSYGKVVKMKMNAGSRFYAVKKPLDLDNPQNRVEKEAEIWSRLDHPNILPLVGFATLDSCSFPTLVSPLCVDNLCRFLRRHRFNASNPLDRRSNLSEKCRLQFIEDIVNGLSHLHSKGFAHGDLRPVNILIRQDESDLSFYAVLADFGSADSVRASQLRSRSRLARGRKTNDIWLSPELRSRGEEGNNIVQVSIEGDVWAFGCVMLEAQYGIAPFEKSNSSRTRLVDAHALPANKEDIEGLRDSHWNLMRHCWETDPSKRISIFNLSATVTRLLEDLP